MKCLLVEHNHKKMFTHVMHTTKHILMKFVPLHYKISTCTHMYTQNVYLWNMYTLKMSTYWTCTSTLLNVYKMFTRGICTLENFYSWSTHTSKQGWEFSHSLIAHLLISLKSNERLRGIRSDRSRQKWATVSKSLRSHKTNERPWANPSSHS